ncbi:MAG: FAD-dependent monooxygenase [Syntrophales bacterium LBB04]|nr:FAD-dependent monooxygenase [Syntrophales bacterium LBB04]
MNDYNVLIIGSGPAGLFAAIWLERLGIERIAIVDRRPYPSGGLLNDGKLNFDYRIGIDLDELQIDRETAQNLMAEIKSVLVRFPQCKQVTFVNNNEKIESLRNIAQEHGAQFIAPEQWHWGTDNGKSVVDYLRSHLRKTDFLLGTAVSAIEKCGDEGYGLICNKKRKRVRHTATVVLAAPGRCGAYWFRDVAKELHIHHNFSPIDVGIRLELNRKYYDALTDIVYDPKFIFRTSRHGDKVRTFCTNPGGRVREENYLNFKLVNGDALSGRKTENTNFALINTVGLTEPFSDTTEFGQMIARQFFLLGGGKPIVQRIGDFREGRRSSLSTFNSVTRHFGQCKATYNAVPGDITLGMPARIIDNLWESLKNLDKIMPGILHPSTLLYAPEIKFFDTHFPTDRNLETNLEGIYVAGDGTGKSRGIVGAGISRILAAKGIAGKYFNSSREQPFNF